MNDLISVEVSFWSESEKSWCLLTKKGVAKGSWSKTEWFPKSICQYDREKGILTLPKWLHKKKFT